MYIGYDMLNFLRLIPRNCKECMIMLRKVKREVKGENKVDGAGAVTDP